jgi:hypothetical protein
MSASSVNGELTANLRGTLSSGKRAADHSARLLDIPGGQHTFIGIDIRGSRRLSRCPPEDSTPKFVTPQPSRQPRDGNLARRSEAAVPRPVTLPDGIRRSAAAPARHPAGKALA